MEVHKPKPVHSWRELLGEIGVIVIGITIALTGEQVIEAINWKHKVADAETAMKREIGGDLVYAAEQLAMKDCGNKYFARMETAVRSRRTDTLRQLAAMGAPFARAPWLGESWTAAINSQIPDHIPRDKLAVYAITYRVVNTEFETQITMVDHYSEVVAGGLIDNPPPEVVYGQLAALEKLKAEFALTMTIADAMLNRNAPRLGVVAQKTDAPAGRFAPTPALCEKRLAAIPE